jgi:hypothetical protein
VVDVTCRIISKVTAREGAIISLRLVEHGDMWRDTLLPFSSTSQFSIGAAP